MEFGLVLGGGGARGLAHVGVWQVLEDAGLRPSVVAGTSMGGLVGAFIAAGYTGAEIERVALSVSWRRLLDLRPGPGLISGAAMNAWLGQHLPETFGGLTLPLAITATDLTTGRAVYLSQGPLAEAIRATTAYPGALSPVPLGGALLSDGGILNQIPVDAALFLGARKVVAVDVTAPDPLELTARRVRLWNREVALGQPHLGTVRALRRAVEIMQAQLTEARLSLYSPDVLLRPQLGNIDLQSFHRSTEAIRAGREVATRELPRLQAVLG